MPNEPESPEYRYKTPVDQCDVLDRKKLEEYRGQTLRMALVVRIAERRPEHNPATAFLHDVLGLGLPDSRGSTREHRSGVSVRGPKRIAGTLLGSGLRRNTGSRNSQAARRSQGRVFSAAFAR